MTTTRAKSKKAVPDICPEISNKISTRGAFSVIEATRQNVLEAFSLSSNCKKLPLVATKASSLSLAGFSPVKVLLKKHIWISPSIASTLTKSPKIFNNKPVNKLVFSSIDSLFGAASTTSSKKMSLVSAIVTPNPFVVPNEILNKISIVLSSTLSKMGQDYLLAVLPNVVSSSRSLLVLEAKQFLPVGSPVFENWADQMEAELSPPLVSETITSCQRFAGWMASTLVPDATFKIKLAHVKTVFQLVHGFLGAKSVSKDNIKLFCLTSFVHLATLKIAKSLVVSESSSPSAAVVLRDMLLGVSAADIKTAFSVFGSVTCVVLKPVGVWQYVVVYFEKLDSAMSVLNYWLVLVSKDNTILSCDKFKAKLVNFPSGCTAFEIIGGQTCFIPHSPESGCHSRFALITFGSQTDLDSAIVKTALPKFSKVFTPCFVGPKFYAKASVLLSFSKFASVSPLVSSPVVVGNSLVLSYLSSLESDLTKFSALVESIVKPIGSLVTTFEQFINSDLVLSSAFGLRINEVLVHMGSFSKTFDKLGREVVSLKKECYIEDINMSGNLKLPSVVGDEVFSNLMSF
ncbi:hypothetical protein G9A89_016052 [Geosiphon pyriformis]|nr:hypothetical protein G9A89_016052 [Geosiphon pyriformis]